MKMNWFKENRYKVCMVKIVILETRSCPLCLLQLVSLATVLGSCPCYWISTSFVRLATVYRAQYLATASEGLPIWSPDLCAHPPTHTGLLFPVESLPGLGMINRS